MSYLLLKADARRIPIADGSVHCCVTSPPYWSLRDYKTPGQLGLEPTPEKFVGNMVEVFREVRRVLRDDGTLWLNIGDTYSASRGAAQRFDPRAPVARRFGCRPNDKRLEGLKPKDLVGIPWMLAFALRADGWYLRHAIPWVKPNAMPSSVEDRPGTAHETIFLLSKRPTYYYDADAVRRPSAQATLDRDRYSRITSGKDGQYAIQHDHETPSDPRGRGLRSTDFWLDALEAGARWLRGTADELDRARDARGLVLDQDGDPLAFHVSTKASKADHYATFPEELVEPCIKAGTSERGCCPACSTPWNRLVDVEYDNPGNRSTNGERSASRKHIEHGSPGYSVRLEKRVTQRGWEPGCDCDAGDPVPCRVFDPFGGSMTVPHVARKLGRIGMATEINPKDIASGISRLSRIGGGQPTIKSADGQLDLFASEAR